MKKSLNIIIALIWFISGLFCKVLNLVPRHQSIVSEITSSQYSKELIITIGVLEICMSLWILSKIQPKLNASIQIGIIALMNIIELKMAADLLLWGKYNSVFALILIMLIYLNSFQLISYKKTKFYAFIS